MTDSITDNSHVDMTGGGRLDSASESALGRGGGTPVTTDRSGRAIDVKRAPAPWLSHAQVTNQTGNVTITDEDRQD